MRRPSPANGRLLSNFSVAWQVTIKPPGAKREAPAPAAETEAAPVVEVDSETVETVAANPIDGDVQASRRAPRPKKARKKKGNKKK